MSVVLGGVKLRHEGVLPLLDDVGDIQVRPAEHTLVGGDLLTVGVDALGDSRVVGSILDLAGGGHFPGAVQGERIIVIVLLKILRRYN